MRLIYLVLDGAPDSIKDESTTLEVARKPALDRLASMSKCGLMYPVGEGMAPESDAAVFSILGYDPHREYAGRGPIEALGAGVRIKEGYEVAFRANFATVEDKSRRLVDRRVGRDLRTEEARELAKALDGMELGKYDGYARAVATVGHRAVVVIGSRTHRLSGNVGNTDPAYEKRGKISVARPKFEMVIEDCKPLDDSEEARRAAELANLFTDMAIRILDEHPVNKRREAEGKLKANAMLLRDSGDSLPSVEPINSKFGKRFAAVAEMPVEIGIARLLGMEVANVPPPTPDKKSDYKIRLDATLSLLKDHDVVYVHLKGPDEPGHDGRGDLKARAVELIDEYFVAPLLDSVDLDDVGILVTSDHATPYRLKAHSGDPVPFMLYLPGIEPDGIGRFTEKECAKGSLGVLKHGWELLPLVFKLWDGLTK